MPQALNFAKCSRTNTPGRYFDGGTGLHLLIKSQAGKYWIFRYTFGSKRFDMGLGKFPAVGLADARRAAYEARALIRNGINPLDKRAQEKVAVTAQKQSEIKFEEFAIQCVEAKRAEWRNRKHGDQWIRTLTKYAFPLVGNKKLHEIETDDVLAILQPIWTAKTETASRLRGRLEWILAAATTRKLRTGMNPAVWRGHLATLLPKPRRVARVRHHRALAYERIPGFIEDLQGREAISALALEFLILTASRTAEVIGARSSEVIGDVWTVPAGRMKAGRTHRVPLVPRSLEVLRRASALDPDSAFLFSVNGKPLSNMAMFTLLRRMQCDATVHGFRSSFRDWAAETTNHPHEVAEMALAHTIRNKAEAAYRRRDLLGARRLLMLDWETYCSKGADNVV